MKTATVRDLRTKFPVLARWMEDGEAIEITRRGRVIAHLTPAAAGKAGTAKKMAMNAKAAALNICFMDENAGWLLAAAAHGG